jgi:two-component system CheB/CheR fusion protein
MIHFALQSDSKGRQSPKGTVAPSAEFGASAVSGRDSEQRHPVIHVVDDDCQIRDGMRFFLEAEGLVVEDYGNGEAFLHAATAGEEGCLLLDARLPGMSGLELLRQLRRDGNRIPTVMITGYGDVAIAVEAMKAGASDFLEKPVTQRRLVNCVALAVEASRRLTGIETRNKVALDHIGSLTPRQKEILGLVLAGRPNKNIAADIGISQRTVENHRASIMRKMGAKSLPELARLVMSVSGDSLS